MLKKTFLFFAGVSALILAANFARGSQSIKGQVSGTATISVGSAAGGGGNGCGGAGQLPCTTGWFAIPNTTFQAWATTGGQAFATHQWLNMTAQAVTMDEAGYDMVTLLPYWTGGYTGASGPATTWYDELIVSSQPIAAPNN